MCCYAGPTILLVWSCIVRRSWGVWDREHGTRLRCVADLLTPQTKKNSITRKRLAHDLEVQKTKDEATVRERKRLARKVRES